MVIVQVTIHLGNKIVVVGANGSGKTTFAKKLSGEIGIPHYELDSVYWQPDWGELTLSEFRKRVDEITRKEQWIIDGNYTRNQDLTILRADSVIWLDYPFFKTIFNVVKRSLSRSITKKPLWHNNKESFRRIFSKDSIIIFAVRTYNRKRARYKMLMLTEGFRNKNWVILRNKIDESDFFDALH